MAGKQYFINDKDADMLAGLLDREVTSLEESISYMEDQKQWMDETDRSWDNLYGDDVKRNKQEIERLKKFGRRLGYVFD